MDTALYNHTVDYVKRLFRDINTNLLRKFSRLFKKEDGGTRNRDWKEMSEERIRDLWNGCRALMESVIASEFKYIKIPKAPMASAVSKFNPYIIFCRGGAIPF
jgi:hypothetical protein